MAERMATGEIAEPVLIFDCETTTDATQKLNFGFFRFGLDYGDEFKTLTEGIFYADDLADREPSGYKNLEAYTRYAMADISSGENANPRLLFISRTEFVNKWLWPIGYTRQGYIVGFNLPFDLSRIAIKAGEARKNYEGGFSLQIWETGMRPRVCYKTIGNRRAFIGFSRIDSPEGKDGYRGRFLDLRTLAFALSSRGHSLRSACEAFGVETGKAVTEEHGTFTTDYIDYARQDVKATLSLYSELMRVYRRHRIDTPATQLFSGASLSKGYFARMGLTPPLWRMDEYSMSEEILGCAAQAFYGGRAECRIRRVPVPVQVLDFTSMYPTVNALMGGWDLLTGETICAEECTSAIQRILDNVTLADCFDPGIWPLTLGVASIKPDNDILPVRAKYDDQQWGIGINRFRCDKPIWYSIADLIASVLLSGKVPTVEKAYRFSADGRLKMNSIPIGSGEVLDPEDDLFITMVDKRQELKGTAAGDFLKIFANAGSYGIFAEMNRSDGKDRKLIDIYSGDTHTTARTTAFESIGRYTFPPLAACITGGARLMLAMLETCIHEAGGTYAFCDTDSMAIVASDKLGKLHHRNHLGEYDEIPILKTDQVRRIQRRFDGLNPYEHVSDLLKLEYTGECYAISAKRYCLYHLDSSRDIVIDKASNHGLGHLLNPIDMDSDDRDWIAGLWRLLVKDRKDEHPPWIFRPALSSYTVTNPAMFRLFKANETEEYAEQIKPANFILVAHPTRWSMVHNDGPLALFAPYESDPAKWNTLEWVNKFDGRRYLIGTSSAGAHEGFCQVKTYYDMLTDYQTHPEYSACDSAGVQCGIDTTGSLHRMTVQASDVSYVGKEGNAIEESQLGLTKASDLCYVYGKDSDRWEFWKPLVLPVLARWSANDVLRYSGVDVSLRRLQAILSGEGTPRASAQAALQKLAADTAASDLRIEETPDSLEVLTTWRDLGVWRQSAS